jgi:hypothetical protein
MEFTVAVLRNPTEHRIPLSQVLKWAEHTTKNGPAGITKRRHGRDLLGSRSFASRGAVTGIWPARWR